MNKQIIYLKILISCFLTQAVFCTPAVPSECSVLTTCSSMVGVPFVIELTRSDGDGHYPLALTYALDSYYGLSMRDSSLISFTSDGRVDRHIQIPELRSAMWAAPWIADNSGSVYFSSSPWSKVYAWHDDTATAIESDVDICDMYKNDQESRLLCPREFSLSSIDKIIAIHRTHDNNNTVTILPMSNAVIGAFVYKRNYVGLVSQHDNIDDGTSDFLDGREFGIALYNTAGDLLVKHSVPRLGIAMRIQIIQDHVVISTKHHIIVADPQSGEFACLGPFGNGCSVRCLPPTMTGDWQLWCPSHGVVVGVDKDSVIAKPASSPFPSLHRKLP